MLLKWFSSYLDNRYQHVKYKNFKSEPINVLSGIPQGSQLSSLLFNIYVNDILHSIKYSDILLFVDDFKIYKAIYNNIDLLHLQIDIDNVVNWASDNGLFFLIQKNMNQWLFLITQLNFNLN